MASWSILQTAVFVVGGVVLAMSLGFWPALGIAVMIAAAAKE
jgi:hypothetical protein